MCVFYLSKSVPPLRPRRFVRAQEDLINGCLIGRQPHADPPRLGARAGGPRGTHTPVATRQVKRRYGLVKGIRSEEIRVSSSFIRKSLGIVY